MHQRHETSDLVLLLSEHGRQGRASPVQCEGSISAAISRNLSTHFRPEYITIIFNASAEAVHQSWVPTAAVRALALRAWQEDHDESDDLPQLNVYFTNIRSSHKELAPLIRKLLNNCTCPHFIPAMFIRFKDCILLGDVEDPLVTTLAALPSMGLAVVRSRLSHILWDERDVGWLDFLEIYLEHPLSLGYPIEKILDDIQYSVDWLVVCCPFLDVAPSRWRPTSSLNMERLVDFTLQTPCLLRPCLELWRFPALKAFTVAIYSSPRRAVTVTDAYEEAADLLHAAIERGALPKLKVIVFHFDPGRLARAQRASGCQPSCQKLLQTCQVRGIGVKLEET